MSGKKLVLHIFTHRELCSVFCIINEYVSNIIMSFIYWYFVINRFNSKQECPTT